MIFKKLGEMQMSVLRCSPKKNSSGPLSRGDTVTERAMSDRVYWVDRGRASLGVGQQQEDFGDGEVVDCVCVAKEFVLKWTALTGGVEINFVSADMEMKRLLGITDMPLFS